ncbi:hypothetical protein [Acinetobacter sp. c3-l95]|uniref:hypothetical protein n=1 Tax=Acinetobacter sp. c3-l95 TaxID=3342804 RepID=UPI0035B7828B
MTAQRDSIKNRSSATTPQVAQAKAQAQLEKDNDQGCEGTFVIDGDHRLTAGSNIHITGFGRFDGKYQIKKAVHRISRSNGYSTEVQFGFIETKGAKA